MSVRLRLRRMGKKKQPFYRIVAMDSRKTRDGRYLENLGTYNPIKNPAELSVKEDRALYWLGQGAIPSFTVRSFFKKKGILHKWHLMKKGADVAVIEDEMKKWSVLQEERLKRLEALTDQRKRSEKKEQKAESKAEKEEAVVETVESPEVVTKKKVKAAAEKVAPEEALIEEAPTEETSTKESAKEEIKKDEA